MPILLLSLATLTACSPCSVPGWESICEDAESDDEAGLDNAASLWCDGEHAPNGNSVICVVRETDDAPSVEFADMAPFGNHWRLTDASDCHFLSGPVPCNREWNEGPAALGDECVMCEAEAYGEDTLVNQADVDEQGWRLCHQKEGGTKGRHSPAVFGPWAYPYLDSFHDDWFSDLMCDPYLDKQISTVCDIVGLDPTWAGHGPGTSSFEFGEWTCGCESDSDCQAGAVCEAGWVMDGIAPHPTLCTWDFGAGDPNGAPAPQGPAAYGLESWDGHLLIEGDRVFVSEVLIDAAVLGAGLFNDSQRAEVVSIDVGSGEVTIEATGVHPESVAGALGIEVGDALTLPSDGWERLKGGLPVAVGVSSLDGYARSMTFLMI